MNVFSLEKVLKDLQHNYNNQTKPFEEIFALYNKFLLKNLELTQENKDLENKVLELRSNLSDPQLFETLKNNAQNSESEKMKFQQEIDILNNSLSEINMNFMDAVEKYNEEKKKREELYENKITLEENLKKALKEIIDLKKDLEFSNKEKEILQKDKDTLLKEKTQLNKDYLYVMDALSSAKKQLADKMNEANELNEDVRRKMSKLNFEKDKFEKEKKEWDKNLKQKKKKSEINEIHNDDKEEVLDKDLSEFSSRKMSDGENNQYFSDFPKNLKKIYPKFHSNEIYSIVNNINGSLLASSGGDRDLKFYDPLKMDIKQIPHSGSL